jgi:hypothetical protein
MALADVRSVPEQEWAISWAATSHKAPLREAFAFTRPATIGGMRKAARLDADVRQAGGRDRDELGKTPPDPRRRAPE